MNKYSKIIAGVGLTLMLIVGAVGVRAQEQQRQLTEALTNQTVDLGVFASKKECKPKIHVCNITTTLGLGGLSQTEEEVSFIFLN